MLVTLHTLNLRTSRSGSTPSRLLTALNYFYINRKRMADYHQAYKLFDFSGPQMIDMELAAEEQCVYEPRSILTVQRPFDVQMHFSIIGMVSLFGPDKEAWRTLISAGHRDGGHTFGSRWEDASAEERHKWLCHGQELLRERLANGTA